MLTNLQSNDEAETVTVDGLNKLFPSQTSLDTVLFVDAPNNLAEPVGLVCQKAKPFDQQSRDMLIVTIEGDLLFLDVGRISTTNPDQRLQSLLTAIFLGQPTSTLLCKEHS